VVVEKFGGAKINMVAAGGRYAMAVTADGDAYTWGCGLGGALGHNDRDDKLMPIELVHDLLGGSGVVMLAAGWAQSGEPVTMTMLTWGVGSHGQLGLGDRSSRLIPTRVRTKEVFDGSSVLMAACGSEHNTLVVTKAGKLWSWGKEEHGTLGHDDDIDRLIPTRVDAQLFDGAKRSLSPRGLVSHRL
jgi:alpha-tubulin suppressor-like RCC1 family protein